jgi:hypothetical protein
VGNIDILYDTDLRNLKKKKKGRKKKGKQSIFRYLGYTEARKLIKIRNRHV